LFLLLLGRRWLYKLQDALSGRRGSGPDRLCCWEMMISWLGRVQRGDPSLRERTTCSCEALPACERIDEVVRKS